MNLKRNYRCVFSYKVTRIVNTAKWKFLRVVTIHSSDCVFHNFYYQPLFYPLRGVIDTVIHIFEKLRRLWHYCRSVDVRYQEICEVAKTRSVISLGLSCFKMLAPNSESIDSGCFQVQTFNITLLCSENYVVEPLSLKFLVQHGFDFNKQYATGIPYYRGPDRVSTNVYTVTQPT